MHNFKMKQPICIFNKKMILHNKNTSRGLEPLKIFKRLPYLTGVIDAQAWNQGYLAFYNIQIPVRPLKCLILSTFHKKDHFTSPKHKMGKTGIVRGSTVVRY